MQSNKQHKWGVGANALAADAIQEALNRVNERIQRTNKVLEVQLLSQTRDHLKSAMQRLVAADKQVK